MNVTDLAISGPLLLAVLVALAAGAISFASVLHPSGPRLLGLPRRTGRRGCHIHRLQYPHSAPESVARRRRGAAVCARLTVVFTIAVLGVLRLSDTLIANELLLQRIGGVVTIVMGLAFLGLIPALQRDVRFHHRPHGGFGAHRCSVACSGSVGHPALDRPSRVLSRSPAALRSVPPLPAGWYWFWPTALGWDCRSSCSPSAAPGWSAPLAGCAAAPESSSSPEARCSSSSARCSPPACGVNSPPYFAAPSADTPHRYSATVRGAKWFGTREGSGWDRYSTIDISTWRSKWD
jgi:hypothetical protein